MSKICLFLLLLAFFAIPAGIQSQETERPETLQQDEPPTPPARRPKLPNVITFESSVGQVHFPHKVHQKMGCQNCHHQIHAKDLLTPHEEYLTYSWVNCRDCHDESENTSTYYGCAKCHHSNLENIADETLNAKVVVHKSCWKCHLSGTGVEASERCGYCHVKEEQPLDLTQESTNDLPGTPTHGGAPETETE
jgi:Zn finger protein HypA/HybF involved in hydrogenase expression